MPEKRPYPADGGFGNGDSKRTRSNDGSPAAPNGPNANMDMERKQAEIAERIAAIKAKAAAAAAHTAAARAPLPSAAPSDADAAKTDMAARIAAMKARMSGGGSGASPSPSPAPTATSPGPQSDAVKQAQVKAQLAAMRARIGQQRPDLRSQAPSPPVREDNATRARGGLGIGLHPALMGDLTPSTANKGKGGPGNKREQEARARSNPYISTEPAVGEEQRNDPTYDPGFLKQRDRKSRQLLFNQKGKFIAQAEALRSQERLEKMKRELQEQARKAGLEQATEKSFLVATPPDIEWWDEGLVNAKTYDDLESATALNFDGITPYVQHPVLLEPPQESNMPASKPMYLTKTEQAKLRRQRRMADHKEEQAKIRLGLKPPPPPKVKKSNLMRVLGQEAVKDPTAVEARVNREIAARATEHDVQNADRQLTKEQKADKLAAQQEADAQKGVKVSVYRIDNLSSGKHRYQIDVNAKQHALTGITILNPKMNLVIVEGGAHSVNAYRKLMLNRVRWSENAAPSSVAEGNREAAERDWLRAVDDAGRLKDLAFNRCTLVWEGEEKARAFKRWGSRVCETDGEAKDVLGRNKMENMWTLAQSML